MTTTTTTKGPTMTTTFAPTLPARAETSRPFLWSPDDARMAAREDQYHTDGYPELAALRHYAEVVDANGTTADVIEAIEAGDIGEIAYEVDECSEHLTLDLDVVGRLVEERLVGMMSFP
jgi:hypothetical protein